jgi:hypothetical protein
MVYLEVFRHKNPVLQLLKTMQEQCRDKPTIAVFGVQNQKLPTLPDNRKCDCLKRPAALKIPQNHLTKSFPEDYRSKH